MVRCRTRAAVVVAILIAVTRAAADPAPVDVPTHLQSASTVHTDGGSDLRLPPGYFLSEPLWAHWDATTKVLQDAQVRLAAENVSLRASAASWQPGWVTVVTVISSGFALGWYAHSKL